MLKAWIRTSARIAALSLLAAGFAPYANGAIISSGEVLEAQARADRVANVERFLARDDVKQQLLDYGVPPETVEARIRNLTDEELLTLEGRIGDQVAGGDAVGIIGAVFLVLIILELVGVTDIFKSF